LKVEVKNRVGKIAHGRRSETPGKEEGLEKKGLSNLNSSISSLSKPKEYLKKRPSTSRPHDSA
jgi:hypothetical protein